MLYQWLENDETCTTSNHNESETKWTNNSDENTAIYDACTIYSDESNKQTR